MRVDAGTASGEHLQVEELPCEQRESGQLCATEQQASARELPIGIEIGFAGFRHRSVNSWDEEDNSITLELSDGSTLDEGCGIREPLNGGYAAIHRGAVTIEVRNTTNEVAGKFRALRFRARKCASACEFDSDGP